MAMQINEVLRSELHGMIVRASSDELFNALHSPSSPLREQFMRFLASSYADWVSTQRDADTTLIKQQWRQALELPPGSGHHAAYDYSVEYESDGPDYNSDVSVGSESAAGTFALQEKKPLDEFLLLSDRPSPAAASDWDSDGEDSKEDSRSAQSSKAQYDALSMDQKTVLKAKLPLLSDISSVEKRNDTLVTKLKLCSVNFDFASENIWQVKGIDKKKAMLSEVLEYIAKYAWYSEAVLHQCIRTIARNLFRALPLRSSGTSEEVEEDFQDPTWPHLQLIYDLTLRLVICTDVDKKIMRRFLEGRFIAGIIELFASEDPREREYLKTILHRIYGRFMPLRQVIRQSIAHCSYRTIYKTRSGNGIAEFLEIFCSIIHGFSVPVKPEHKGFLRNVLIPLHKCAKLEKFHEQLVACCVQFVFKDKDVAPIILGGLLRFWPKQSPTKEEMFIAEIVNIIKAMVNHKQGFRYEERRAMVSRVVDQLVTCMLSAHHSVAERALVVWTEDAIEVLVDMDKRTLWPKIIRGFLMNKSHWNMSLREYNEGAMDGFRVRDAVGFDAILADLESLPPSKLKRDTRSKDARRKRKYERLRAVAERRLLSTRRKAA